MTKVLVTGASGVLGRELVPLIERDGGFALRLTDAVPLETSHEFVRADLARWEEAEHLCDGVDEVVHVAAIHRDLAAYAEALAKRLAVMDSTAFSLCLDNNIPIIVFDFFKKNSFRDVVDYAEKHGVNNRIAAYMLALDRVAFAIKLRGIYA